MRVLVTGAGGFIGRHVVAHLATAGHDVRAFTTSAASGFPAHVQTVQARRENGHLPWNDAIHGIDAILHLAGRAHVVRESASQPLEEFRKVNVRDTVELATSARAAGVRRFIFVSSIGVNGSATSAQAFTEDRSPRPTEAYAISKWEAEQALHEIAADGALELTILRLPLVYGPGVKGNFLRLLRLVDRGIPLPLGAIANQRSYLGVANFCEAISCCLAQRADARGLFLLADGEDISTPRLLTCLAAAMGRPARIWSVPLGLLRLTALVTGRSADLERLSASLQVDASRARRVIGWQPVADMAAGIGAMAQWYLKQGR